MKKLSNLLSLIIGVLGKRQGEKGGERGLNKWNIGKIIERS